MKMKKKKEDNILSETPKRQNSKKIQLKNMLKSMEDRSDPVTTHRVVTNYFDKFREERNIPKTETKQSNITAVDTDIFDFVQFRRVGLNLNGLILVRGQGKSDLPGKRQQQDYAEPGSQSENRSRSEAKLF